MKWNFLYQITAASRTPDCPQLNLLNPPWTKFLGTPLLVTNYKHPWDSIETYLSATRIHVCAHLCVVKGVPLATEPGISLIILPLMRILQRNLKRTYLSVWEMWRHHNMCWKWAPFASRQDWTRRAIFWKVLASTSAVTAWISSVVFAFKATMVRGLFW